MPPLVALAMEKRASQMLPGARHMLAQPRGRAQATPRKGMTWLKATIVLIVTVIFDALRFIFVMLVFTLPFIIGAVAAAYASNTSWLSWAPSWVIGLATSIGIATLEVFNPEAIPAIAAFGVLMASIIGFIGFLFVLGMLLAMRVKLTPHNQLWLGLAFVGGVTPFGNALPSLTPITLKIVRRQMRDDKKAHALYLKQQAALQAAQQQEQNAALSARQQMLALEAAQQEEAAAESEDMEAAEDQETEGEQEEPEPPQPKRREPLVGVPSLIPESAPENAQGRG